LAGRTFGEALLETRKHFLSQNRNPLGLLYSSYLSLDAVLENLLLRDSSQSPFYRVRSTRPVPDEGERLDVTVRP
jgi:hypothetical protein